MAKKSSTSLAFLETIDSESGDYNVVIDTPKGHRNKFRYEEKLDRFSLSGVLTAGAVFPHDFGFLPQTVGGDGDPLDVLVLMDEPAFSGCIVRVRLIGIIEAEQTEKDGTTERNDRLIAVATESHEYCDVKDLSDLSKSVVDQIEYFFISYNKAKGKKFKPIARHGNRTAKKMVEKGMKAFRKEKG